VPLVTASGLAGYGPANQIRTRRILHNLYLVGDEEPAARPGMGLMAPRVGVAASHQANAVLRLLLGLEVGEDE
jgi:sulfur carrier protein ThiS adenylyltransferase